MPRKPSIEAGQQFTNVNGQVATVLEYNTSMDILIRFDESNVVKTANASQLRTGKFTERKNFKKGAKAKEEKKSQSLFDGGVDTE
jgi:hypothetical protein